MIVNGYCVKRFRMDEVHSDWKELCQVLAVPMEKAEKWWIHIRECYQSDGRHYHTLNHIHSMLSHLKKFQDRIRCYEEVSLAIFFHELDYSV